VAYDDESSVGLKTESREKEPRHTTTGKMADASELHGVLRYLQAHGFEDAVNAILVQQQQQQQPQQSRQRGGSLR
jgi:hypothetical protein